jgi:hypothetical protein
VTRFKELRRIEAAIEYRHIVELRWALDYCEMRLRIARLQTHRSHWRKLAQQIRATLAQGSESD